MIINNETDYAFRILRCLADGERHNVAHLCDDEVVPQQFAYKILRKLAAGGLVKSTRGVNGGVQLTCDLRKVTMLDIVELTDTERYVTDCMRPGSKCNWIEKHCKQCTVHRRIYEIQRKLDEEMRKCTVAELLGEAYLKKVTGKTKTTVESKKEKSTGKAKSTVGSKKKKASEK